LAEIDNKIDQLKELHRKRLMVTFDADEQAQVCVCVKLFVMCYVLSLSFFIHCQQSQNQKQNKTYLYEDIVRFAYSCIDIHIYFKKKIEKKRMLQSRQLLRLSPPSSERPRRH
jgi:hypothetical protein